MIEGTKHKLSDVVPDLPSDGRLPDGRPWPPAPGAQPWSVLWRRLAEMIGNLETAETIRHTD